MRGRFLLWILAAPALGACSGWWGESDDGPRLAGDRLPALTYEQRIEAEGEGKPDIRLSAAVQNRNWPQAGGGPSHATGHLAGAPKLEEAWTADIGSGSNFRNKVLAEPVVVGGTVYTLDSRGDVRAFSARDGGRLWDTMLRPMKNRASVALRGAGLGFGDGKLLATSGMGVVHALDPKDGKLLWGFEAAAPFRSAPLIYEGKVYAQTVNNQIYALSLKDGKVVWQNDFGAELTMLLGGATPAASNGILILGLSSGEIVALRAETGDYLWGDSVAPAQVTDMVSMMPGVSARPVVDGRKVFVQGNTETLLALDLRTGDRLWEKPFGGMNQVSVSGNAAFLMTAQAKLAALDVETGRVLWVSSFKLYENEADLSGRVTWHGPVLVQNRLILVSSGGSLVAVSPRTGKTEKTLELGDGVSVSPVAAGGLLYVVTDGGSLIAFR